MRGRHGTSCRGSTGNVISIHAPLRGRHRRTECAAWIHPISIHAPLRGRRCPEESCSKPWQFQSTPPCGGDESRIVFSQRHGNFNPRPLAGATICTGTRDEDLVISIHAPLRGRRGGYSMQTYYDNISIHAPLRGRQSWEHERIIIIIISIHAPLRGRLVRSARTQARGRFQSTPPCGGDYCPKYRISASAYFNPRPLAGATKVLKPSGGMSPFQSTPPCGGDCWESTMGSSRSYFNPRPLAGATLEE